MDFLKWTIHFHELGDPSKAMVWKEGQFFMTFLILG